jgi:hypothetical protein
VGFRLASGNQTPPLDRSVGSLGAGRRTSEESPERSLKDRIDVVGISLDRGDRDDHLEDLLQREVIADLVYLPSACGAGDTARFLVEPVEGAAIRYTEGPMSG